MSTPSDNIAKRCIGLHCTVKKITGTVHLGADNEERTSYHAKRKVALLP